MANLLPFRVKVPVIRALVDGNSIRAAHRLTEVHKDVVMRLGRDVGLGCMKLHNKLVRGVPAGLLEVDECWSYVGIHEKRKEAHHPKEFGDAYTFFAIETDTKFVPAYLTGKRTPADAKRFMVDLRSRIVGRPQMSVDGWPAWTDAVAAAFGHTNIDLGLTVKEYQPRKAEYEGDRGRRPLRVKSVSRTRVFGKPYEELISTAIAERMNLTSRMQQRRLARLTNAYSKKLVNLQAAVGLHFFFYNFCREHETLKTTPAVKAKVVKEPWTIERMVTEALREMDIPIEHAPRPENAARYTRKTHAPCLPSP